jgi:hypothetical protein
MTAAHFPEMRRAWKRLKAAWRDWRLAIRLERERKAWRERMMAAVKEAAREGLFAPSSLADGLRVIRVFEEVNGCQFDPDNDYHLLLITNMGWRFALDRKLARLRAQEERAR